MMLKGSSVTCHFVPDVSKILSSSFVSKIFALLFLFLKTNICYIVNRDIRKQKQWTKIVLISIEVHLVDFRLSCKSVGAQLW